MDARQLSDTELLRQLNAHPQVRNRIESILSVVSDESGELARADDAEIRLIEEIRRLGQETLTAWAQQQVSQTAHAASQAPRTWREGKKNSAGTAPSATSA